MLQHLPPLVVDRLWDMFADAAGSGFYAVEEYLEEEEGIPIEEIPMPSHSAPALSLDTNLAGRDRTTTAEILKVVPDTVEKELPGSKKQNGSHGG